MTLKDDYYQMSTGEYRVYIDRSDDCVQVWWKAKDEDGNVFPVELQMSRKGAMNLVDLLLKAVSMLSH